MKAYKSTTPENTVNNIREILYKCGILLKDNHIDNDTTFFIFEFDILFLVEYPLPIHVYRN